MKVLSYFDVAAQQVVTHAVDVIRLDGYFKGSTNDRWLQAHDSAVTPANAAVPLIEWFLPKSAAFIHEFELGLLHLTKGLYIVVSTTEGTLTASTDKMDLSVELDKVEEPSGTSFAGDLSTPVTGVQAWANVDGPKRLIAIEIDSTGAGAGTYALLFARNLADVVVGDVPIDCFKVANNAVLTGINALRFGNDGRDVSQQVGATLYKGCSVIMSATPGSYQEIPGTVLMKLEYK